MHLCREEKDPGIKNRLMLNIGVRFDGISIIKATRSWLGHVLEQQVVQLFCKDQPGGIAEPTQIRKVVTDHGIGGAASRHWC